MREYSLAEKKRIAIAALAAGNSVYTLCEMILDSGSSKCWDEHFQELLTDFEQSRKDAPESFETTVEQEFEMLLELEAEHQHEYNKEAWA